MLNGVMRRDRVSSRVSRRAGALAVAAAAMLAALSVASEAHALQQNNPKPNVDNRQQPVQVPARRPATNGGPRISVETEELDFGVSYDESRLQGVIRFTNTGDSLLVVQNVRTSCGCTAAALVKREFAPGEVGEIEVGFSPSGSGRQVKTVTIVSNDPTTPAAVVRVAATLVPLVEIADPTLRLGQVEQGTQQVVPLELFSRDPNFTIAGVSFNEDTHITWREVPGAKPSVERPEMPGFRLIEFVIDPSTPTGNFNRTITLDLRAKSPEANQTKDLNYTVRLFGVILGDLSVEPRFLRVPRVDPGASFESSVVIVSRSGRPFNIVGVDVAAQQMQMFVREHSVTHEKIKLPDGREGVRVTLKGVASSRVGAFRCDITLHTDRPGEPTVVVTANGQVRPLQPIEQPEQQPNQNRPLPTPRQ
jgi:hypothetical protein